MFPADFRLKVQPEQVNLLGSRTVVRVRVSRVWLVRCCALSGGLASGDERKTDHKIMQKNIEQMAGECKVLRIEKVA